MCWDFDGEASTTMIRPSKSNDGQPMGNHTPNHHSNKESVPAEQANSVREAEEEEEEVFEVEPQLGIDDTAFVSERKSILSTEGKEGEESNRRDSVILVAGNGEPAVMVSQQ